MIVYHVLNILHDFCISPMRFLGHLLNSMTSGFEDTSGLGMYHKWNRK